MGTTKMVSQVQLFVPLDLQGAPAHVVEQWGRTQDNNLDLTEQKRRRVIPDEAAYINKMAGPSSEVYAAFVSPGFISRSGKDRNDIVAAQFKNASAGYPKYRHSLDKLYGPGPNGPGGQVHKEKVAAMREVYSRRFAQRTLPFTGEKTIGKSVSGIAPRWLTGDQTVHGLIRGADRIIGGGPVNVARLDAVYDLRGTLRSGLSGLLTKSGVAIINGDYQANVVKRMNDNINAVINGLQNQTRFTPFATGGASHCDYILIENLLYLEIQVTEIVP